MSRKVTQLPASRSDSGRHNGKGNALTKQLPRVTKSPVSQADPDLPSRQAVAESYAAQSDGVEQMASRMKKFQGPWSAIPQPTDDNIEGGY